MTNRKLYITKALKIVSKEFIHALFPPTCVMCGDFFHADDMEPEEPLPDGLQAVFRDSMRLHLCRRCNHRFVAAEPPICTCCGLIFRSREGRSHLCGECLETERPFGIARSAGVYDQALMTIIHRYKYSGKIEMATPLSALLIAVYDQHWRSRAVDLVVPVPLHPVRHRSRGFNQAYLLTRPWGQMVNRDVLQRKKPTAPQTGLGRKMRQSNIRDAFAIKDSSIIDGKHILLVDDVYTTGATVGECSRLLKKNGAKCVDVLTLARAVT